MCIRVLASIAGQAKCPPCVQAAGDLAGDLPIGRIYKAHGVGGRDIWTWGVLLPNIPQFPDLRGSSSDLEGAKALQSGVAAGASSFN